MAEYAALKHAAAPTGDGILMFMANAALENVTQSGAVSLKRAAKQPSCLCFYDGGVGELTGEIPLVQRELSSATFAALRQHTSLDQFIANAIKEKLARESSPSISEPVQEARQEVSETGHDRLHLNIPAVVTAIDLLCDAYWESINQKDDRQTMHANGLITLADNASTEVKTALPLAMNEWSEAIRAAQQDAQRRAA